MPNSLILIGIIYINYIFMNQTALLILFLLGTSLQQCTYLYCDVGLMVVSTVMVQQMNAKLVTQKVDMKYQAQPAATLRKTPTPMVVAAVEPVPVFSLVVQPVLAPTLMTTSCAIV